MLRTIILSHFGLVTFGFHYGRTPKPIMFMIFGFLDVSMTPKTNMIYRWRHKRIQNNSRKIPNHFSKYDLGESHKLGNCQF